MASKNVLPIVSAAVTPAIMVEIDRLAKAKKVTRSTMVRALLEERLTQLADERLTDVYEHIEKRLRHIENRFSALMVKNIRLTAQNLYLNANEYRSREEMTKERWETLNEKARNFAGDQLKATKTEPTEEQP